MSEQIVSTRATIKALEGEFAWVEVAQGGCGRCHEKGGCGGQNLSQALCSASKRYLALNPECLPVGAEVTVAVAAGAVRASANLAYGAPLLALVVGALIGQALGGDWAAMVGGGLGLGLAWWRLKQISSANLDNSGFQPYIVPHR